MNISESILSHQDFCYFLARIMTNIDEYPSCKKLLLSGIHLIGQDDLRHGLDDLRDALEMLLKDLIQNNLSIERQSQKKISELLLKNGWGETMLALWPMTMKYFKRYQNSHVKHDDGLNITEQDAELVIIQALQLIMCLVCKKQ
uniref:hypothetical protein n=1 Tax=Prevotella sp. TaxID=59823 RepID=UPI0025D3F583